MRERILAIVGAVALVAVAFAVRSALTDDESGGGGGGGGGGDRPVVACTPDLMAVCEALVADGRIAADPPTLDLDTKDRAVTTAKIGDRRIEGWITWDPAPAVANFIALDEDLAEPWGETRGIGVGQLGVLVRTDKVENLKSSCGGAVDWTCIASQSALPVGVGSADSAEGLSRIAPLAKALDVNDENEVEASALREVLDGPPSGQQGAAAQAIVLITRPGELGLVVGRRGALRLATETERGKNSSVIDVEPASTASVVVAWRAGESLSTSVVDALGRDGAKQTLEALGVAGPGSKLADRDLAGFLYQVREKVG